MFYDRELDTSGHFLLAHFESVLSCSNTITIKSSIFSQKDPTLVESRLEGQIEYEKIIF